VESCSICKDWYALLCVPPQRDLAAAFVNLLQRALDAMPQGGTVTLRAGALPP